MYKVIDLHCDSVFSLMDGKDLRQNVPGVHVDLPRLRKGGVGLQVFAAYVSPSVDKDKAFAYANERLDAINAFATSDENLIPVETASEARTAMVANKTGIMVSIENGLAIEGSLEKLDFFRRRKVRIITLVHSQHNSWVASCTGSGNFITDDGSDPGSGLNRFGEKVVDAMNDLGIIPDVSHASENAFWTVIRKSKKPIIASHSCAWNICASARNLKDDQLKALGDSGGVVGVNFNSIFLSEALRLEYEEKKHYKKAAELDVPVPMTIIADHIDYMLNMAGEDCVALGSDFDGIPATPDGVTGSDFFPVLEAELKARGYSEKRIEKIFNANFLRLLEQWD